MHIIDKIIKKAKQINRKRLHAFRRIKLIVVCKVIDFLINNKFTRNIPPLNPLMIKKVLLLRQDGKIGDSVVASGLIRALEQAGIQVDVVTGEGNSFIYKNGSFKGQVFNYKTKGWRSYNIALSLQQQNYDMLLDLSEEINVGHYLFINFIRAKYMLGFNKEAFDYYNINIPFRFPDKHVSERFIAALAIFGLATKDYCYHLSIPDVIEKETLQFLESLPPTNKIVINTSGACQSRLISQEQLNYIISKIRTIQQDAVIIVIGSSQRLEMISLPEGVVQNPFTSYYSAAVIVKNAALLISPDTSWVHVGRIYCTPLIALYGSAITFGGFTNNKVWAPNYAQATQIITTEKNISSIPNEEIGVEIERYMQTTLGLN